MRIADADHSASIPSSPHTLTPWAYDWRIVIKMIDLDP